MRKFHFKMIVAVKCPSCNANLQIPDDAEFVTCEYCHTVIKVRDIVRVETDYDVPEWIKIADNAYKGDNYDEAYEYYNMVLEKESNHANAWIGKGLAAGRLSNESEERFDEMLQLVTYGLNMKENKNADDDKIYAKKEVFNILEKYFSDYRKDKFDDKSDFDDYIKDKKQFVEACFKCSDDFYSKDIPFTKFFAEVLRNLLQVNYDFDGEKRTKIEITEPLKSKYTNKLREIEGGLDALDKNYVTYDEEKRRNLIKKLIITGGAILITAVIVIFVVKYFMKVVKSEKSRTNNEEVTTSKLPSTDYEIISKSVKNKRIIYTIFTETTSLETIEKYADALVSRDEEQAQSITIYFLSDKNEAKEYASKDIPLKQTNKSMPDSFSARVRYTKGKDSKELHYYENSKLTSVSY